jgi:small-conductance mechanosensitive channel
MANVTIGLSIILMLLGVGGYSISGGASVTALIPSFFGIVFLVLGLMALKEKLKKHAMHAASVLALLALGGTAGGVVKSVKLALGQEVARPQAVVVQAIMFVLCATFLALCVKSFIDARKRRQAAG